MTLSKIENIFERHIQWFLNPAMSYVINGRYFCLALLHLHL